MLGSSSGSDTASTMATTATDKVLFQFSGALEGHTDWVTSITTECGGKNNIFVSGSRDKNLLVWKILQDDHKFATPVKSLVGHSHFVSDVQLTNSSEFVISSSWDKTLRLWDMATGSQITRFTGHTKEVLSLSLSPSDNRQIISGSADRTIKLWNTVAECKGSLVEKGHSDWITSIHFSPAVEVPIVVSGSCDKTVKAWNMTEGVLKTTYTGHTGYLNAVTVSPDGTLCASGGQDGNTMLWDLSEQKYLYCLETGDVVNALAFSPKRYWLCTAVGPVVKVWDLESKLAVGELVPELPPPGKYAMGLICTSLAWSSDGVYLFAGYSDGRIIVWKNIVSTTKSSMGAE